jgi:hypothetical protein
MGIFTLIFLSLSTSYVFVISQNIPFSSPIALFNWNPPPKENIIPIFLSYPETINIYLGGNTPYFSVVFALEYNGSLAENTLIKIVNASCICTDNKNIDISVTFPEAVDSTLKHAFSSGSALIGSTNVRIVTFHNAMIGNSTGDTYVRQIFPSSQSDFYFPVSGDYSPTIQISIQNEPDIIYTFSQVRVHVLSTSEADNVKIGKINLGLSYALFGLSIIGGVWLLYELLKNEEEKQVFNISIKMNPENSKESPSKNKAKINSFSTVQPYSDGKGKPNDEIKDNETNNKPENNKP